MLGFRAKHFPSLRFFAGRFWGLKRRELERHDAFTDIPVIPVYKQLDERFPGSKFILTERDVEAWLGSCEGFRRFQPGFETSPKVRALRSAVYGTEIFDRERFRRVYAEHEADVERHFADRPGDLLRMDVTAGDGWERLCPFLGRRVPEEPFPHLNAHSPPSTH